MLVYGERIVKLHGRDMASGQHQVFSGGKLMLHKFAGVCFVVFSLAGVAGFAGEKKDSDFKPGSYSGKWFKDKVTLTFDGNGKFSLVLAKPIEVVLVKGSAKVTKDEIEFTDEEGTLKSEGTG